MLRRFGLRLRTERSFLMRTLAEVVESSATLNSVIGAFVSRMVRSTPHTSRFVLRQNFGQAVSLSKVSLLSNKSQFSEVLRLQ